MQNGSSTHRVARVMSTQKLPIVSRLLAGDAANERDRERDAGRGRYEVVIRQPRHLREIAHRRFADVGLPVRVGRERGGGVEREIGCDAAQPLRVERQERLERCIRAYSTSIETRLNGSIVTAYSVQRISCVSSTPVSR